MTERTDQLLLDACCTLVQPPKSFSDLQPWREYREQMALTLKLLDKRLADADREEYEALQKRMRELQARLAAPDSIPESLGIGVSAMARGEEDGWPAPPAPAVKPAPKPAPKRPEIDSEGIVASPSYAETDAGSGRGGSREPPMTTEEFREQLMGLRDRVTDRRARLGLV